MGQLLAIQDRLVLGSLAGAKAVAYYAVPYNFVTKLSIFSNSLGVVLFPRFAAQDGDESRSLAQQSTQIIIVFLTPMVIVLMGVLRPFLELWLGRDFAGNCAGVGELVLVGVWLSSLIVPHNHRLLAEAKLKNKFIMLGVVEIPMYAGFLYLGITGWGVAGAAAAWSLRLVVDTTLLLLMAGAFRVTFRFAFPALVLICLSLALVFWPGLGTGWCLGGVLILALASLAPYREPLAWAFKAVRAKLKPA